MERNVLLRPIRYMLAVAEHRNFTRAADALHVSQPALSQQIRQLERELGGQLFDRSGRMVSLTDFGRAYIEHARHAVRDLEMGQRALHDVRDLSRGHLRLAYTPTFIEYLIGPLVAHFHALHPGIVIELTEASLEDIESALETDAIDLAIGFTEVRSEEIDVEPLFLEQLTLVTSVSHALAGRTSPLELDELQTLPLALLTRGFVSRAFADSYFRTHGIEPNIVVQANSISAVLQVVKTGNAATLLPGAMRREHGELAYIPLAPEFPSRTVALLRRKEAYRSAASDAFAGILRTALSSGALADVASYAGHAQP